MHDGRPGLDVACGLGTWPLGSWDGRAVPLDGTCRTWCMGRLGLGGRRDLGLGSIDGRRVHGPLGSMGRTCMGLGSIDGLDGLGR